MADALATTESDDLDQETAEALTEADRLEEVETMLLAMTRPTTVQRVLAKEWGVSRRRVREYIKRVRDRWAVAAEVLNSPEEHETYRAQIRASIWDGVNEAVRKGDLNQRLRGLSMLAQLDGLNKPARVEVAGKDGGPVEHRIAIMPLEVARQVAQDGPMRHSVALPAEGESDDE